MKLSSAWRQRGTINTLFAYLSIWIFVWKFFPIFSCEFRLLHSPSLFFFPVFFVLFQFIFNLSLSLSSWGVELFWSWEDDLHHAGDWPPKRGLMLLVLAELKSIIKRQQANIFIDYYYWINHICRAMFRFFVLFLAANHPRSVNAGVVPIASPSLKLERIQSMFNESSPRLNPRAGSMMIQGPRMHVCVFMCVCVFVCVCVCVCAIIKMVIGTMRRVVTVNNEFDLNAQCCTGNLVTWSCVCWSWVGWQRVWAWNRPVWSSWSARWTCKSNATTAVSTRRWRWPPSATLPPATPLLPVANTTLINRPSLASTGFIQSLFSFFLLCHGGVRLAISGYPITFQSLKINEIQRTILPWLCQHWIRLINNQRVSSAAVSIALKLQRFTMAAVAGFFFFLNNHLPFSQFQWHLCWRLNDGSQFESPVLLINHSNLPFNLRFHHSGMKQHVHTPINHETVEIS